MKDRDKIRRAVDRELDDCIDTGSDIYKIIEQVGVYLRLITNEIRYPNNMRDYSTSRRLIDRDKIEKAYYILRNL